MNGFYFGMINSAERGIRVKEQNSLKEFDEVIENIDRLTGEDARAFLKLIHGYLSIVEEGDGTLLIVTLLKRFLGFIKGCGEGYST